MNPLIGTLLSTLLQFGLQQKFGQQQKMPGQAGVMQPPQRRPMMPPAQGAGMDQNQALQMLMALMAQQGRM